MSDFDAFADALDAACKAHGVKAVVCAYSSDDKEPRVGMSSRGGVAETALLAARLYGAMTEHLTSELITEQREGRVTMRKRKDAK